MPAGAAARYSNPRPRRCPRFGTAANRREGGGAGAMGHAARPGENRANGGKGQAFCRLTALVLPRWSCSSS